MCFIETKKHTNFLRKLLLFILTIIVQMLWENASIVKECLLSTQFDKFETVKQANLLLSKSGKTFVSCSRTE